MELNVPTSRGSSDAQDAPHGSAGRPSGRLSVGPAGESWWGRARWFVKGVLGENAYQAYLAHHQRSGCATPALSERDYWRSRSDWQERNPQGRCC